MTFEHLCIKKCALNTHNFSCSTKQEIFYKKNPTCPTLNLELATPKEKMKISTISLVLSI